MVIRLVVLGQQRSWLPLDGEALDWLAKAVEIEQAGCHEAARCCQPAHDVVHQQLAGAGMFVQLGTRCDRRATAAAVDPRDIAGGEPDPQL